MYVQDFIKVKLLCFGKESPGKGRNHVENRSVFFLLVAYYACIYLVLAHSAALNFKIQQIRRWRKIVHKIVDNRIVFN